MEFNEGKKRPPPYHIAAAYSKNAHFFNNLDQLNGSMEKPKNFTQELPKNISMPQPVHFHKRITSDEKYLVNELNKRFSNSVSEDELANHNQQPENLQNRAKSPVLLHVDLTPCCYVLGFSVTYNENVGFHRLSVNSLINCLLMLQGVFISKVDENGNAHQKLFPGDQILMLGKQDLTKLEPFLAYKTVLIQGPEAESFFISRS